MQAFQSFLFRVLVGALLLPGARVIAQQPVFRTELEADEVVEGSRFEISFVLQNASGRDFKAPDMRPFRVLSGPNAMSGMGFINGKSYKHQSWTYVLEAGKPGLYALGAARVNAQGEVLRTSPVQVRVRPSNSARGKGNAPADRDDALFIQGELSASEAFVGQQVIYRIVLYTRMTVSNPELLSMPQTDKAYTYELRRFDTRTRYEQIRGQQYAVRTLFEMAVFPQEAGRQEISVAQMRIGVEQSGTLGALFGPKPVLLQTQPVFLSVKPLPSPAPEAFCGGVGQYDWKVGVDRATISTDDAVTLSIAISGNGDMRRLAPLAVVAPEGVEIYEPKVREEEEYENGEQLVHTRTYDYILLPKRNGQFEIQPALVYFDPDSNRYVTKSLQTPIRIEVEPGKASPASPFDAIQEDKSSFWSLVLQWVAVKKWWLLMVVSAVGLGWVLWRRFRPVKAGKASSFPESSVPSQPASGVEEMAAIRLLIGNGDPVVFYDRLYRVVLSHFGTRFGLPPAQWSEPVLLAQMQMRGYPDAAMEATRVVLRTCEQVLFAGQNRSGQMQEMWQMAAQVLRH